MASKLTNFTSILLNWQIWVDQR